MLATYHGPLAKSTCRHSGSSSDLQLACWRNFHASFITNRYPVETPWIYENDGIVAMRNAVLVELDILVQLNLGLSKYSLLLCQKDNVIGV